jgi:hypothetical protein
MVSSRSAAEAAFSSRTGTVHQRHRDHETVHAERDRSEIEGQPAEPDDGEERHAELQIVGRPIPREPDRLHPFAAPLEQVHDQPHRGQAERDPDELPGQLVGLVHRSDVHALERSRQEAEHRVDGARQKRQGQHDQDLLADRAAVETGR